jgi:hypothetical protein
MVSHGYAFMDARHVGCALRDALRNCNAVGVVFAERSAFAAYGVQTTLARIARLAIGTGNGYGVSARSLEKRDSVVYSFKAKRATTDERSIRAVVERAAVLPIETNGSYRGERIPVDA